MNFRISAFVKIGAIIIPIIKIVTTEIMAVILVDSMFYSAWDSDSLAYIAAKLIAYYLKALFPFSMLKKSIYSLRVGLYWGSFLGFKF